jgi:hypothetical protein
MAPVQIVRGLAKPWLPHILCGSCARPQHLGFIGLGQNLQVGREF